MSVDVASVEYRNIVDEATKRWNTAADDLNRLTQARIRTIPEEFFQAVLLPILRAWVRKEDVEIGHWLNIADGLNNPINVADRDGKIIFRVPPPFIDIPIRSERLAGRLVTPHHLVTQQVEAIRNGDARCVMTIEHELANIFTPRPEDKAKVESILMLVDIYRHYSLPMEEVLGPNAETLLKKYDAAKAGQEVTTTSGVVDAGVVEEERFEY